MYQVSYGDPPKPPHAMGNGTASVAALRDEERALLRWAQSLVVYLTQSLTPISGNVATVARASMIYGEPISGTMDGSNTVFTFDYNIAIGLNGKPQATLNWRRAKQFYTDQDPPPYGFWTLRQNPQQIVLGEAPALGDELEFDSVAIR